jgi:hypothetical protein
MILFMAVAVVSSSRPFLGKEVVEATSDVLVRHVVTSWVALPQSSRELAAVLPVLFSDPIQGVC